MALPPKHNAAERHLLVSPLGIQLWAIGLSCFLRRHRHMSSPHILRQSCKLPDRFLVQPAVQNVGVEFIVGVKLSLAQPADKEALLRSLHTWTLLAGCGRGWAASRLRAGHLLVEGGAPSDRWSLLLLARKPCNGCSDRPVVPIGILSCMGTQSP